MSTRPEKEMAHVIELVFPFGVLFVLVQLFETGSVGGPVLLRRGHPYVDEAEVRDGRHDWSDGVPLPSRICTSAR